MIIYLEILLHTVLVWQSLVIPFNFNSLYSLSFMVYIMTLCSDKLLTTLVCHETTLARFRHVFISTYISALAHSMMSDGFVFLLCVFLSALWFGRPL